MTPGVDPAAASFSGGGGDPAAASSSAGGGHPAAASFSGGGGDPAPRPPQPKRVRFDPDPLRLFYDPPAPLPVVIFHSCGYHTVHLCTPRKILQEMHEVNETQMQYLLQKGGFPGARAINCLQFADPDPVTHHYGTNPRIMEGVLFNEDMVVAFFRRMHALFLTGSREFYFYCRSGNHRSVALAELCAYVYNHTGCASAIVDHMMQWKWASMKCGICNNCDSERDGYQESVAAHYQKMLALTRGIV